MRTAHRVADVRAAESALQQLLPPDALLQRAAAGLAAHCAQRLGRVYGSRVVLLVGAGNNGADALVAGGRLAARGARVSAVLSGAAQGDRLASFRAAGGTVGTADDLDDADLVVDGLVGIGGRGPLRPAAAELALAAGAADVVAVDLPSGVAADSGAVEGPAVRAALTVTFGTLKPGLLLGAGRRHAGTVVLVDIGLGPHLGEPDVEVLTGVDVALALPVPPPEADKYSRGVVGVVAGSDRYPGAAVLCTGAAVSSGAGAVRFGGAPGPASLVRSRHPEVLVTEAAGADLAAIGRVQAWAIGPGLGTGDDAAAALEAVLSRDEPVLVDADALTVLAQHPDWARRRSAPTVLTPHDREYERFGRPVGADRAAAARQLATDLGVTVLLKGEATVVAGPSGGPVRVNPTGTPALATAGTGDVLSGACGSLLAQGLPAFEAASVAAWLHGRAGRLAARGGATWAGEVAAAWPAAVRSARAEAGLPG